MILSVTPLGARDGRASAAVAKVVDYLDGRCADVAGRSAEWWDAGEVKRPAIDVDGSLPAAPQGALAYYADSVEGPGRWLGRGILSSRPNGPVAREELERMLGGQHPITGRQLLDGRGSALRTTQLGREEADVASRGAPDELLGISDAASLLGVSPRYLRRVASRTAQARAAHAGPDELVFDHPYLDAERSGDAGHWKVRRREVSRFASERTPPAAVIGYDLTFSVPKSVSILWARSGPAHQGEILAALDASVDAAMAYLEDTATFVRAGPSSLPERAKGLLAASYTHATSRALDPQLHCHVVVANMAEGADGRVRALDGRALFAHAKTASYLAAAELRTQLTRRLGVAWERPERGLADIAGVSRPAIVEMSKRSRELEAVLGDLEVFYTGGRHMRSRGRQVAAYITRAAKDERGVDPNALRPWWDSQLDSVGFSRRALGRCLDRQAAPQLITAEDRAKLFSQLSSARGITELSATFTRREVIQAVGDWAGDRLSAAEVRDLAEDWITTADVVALEPHSTLAGRSGDVIRRRDGRTVNALAGETLYTTQAMLAVEERLLAGYEAGRNAGAGVIDPELVEATLAERSFLGGDQVKMLRSIWSSGHRIQCVLGPAGSGKTTAMEAAALGWERAGYRVIGAALQATHAEKLESASGIKSSTVASLLVRLDAHRDGDLPTSPLDARTVLVIDECSALPNRDLARLIDHVATAGATMRLVGDPAQHSAVAAGGGWRVLLERYSGDRCELRERRRQAAPEMAEVRLASVEYAEGRIAEAIERLRRDDRLVEADSPDELLDALVADWYVDRLHELQDPDVDASSMISDFHFERRELNRRARALLAADGTLRGPVVEIGDLSFQAGDEIIALTQLPKLRPPEGPRSAYVRNAERGVVVEAHPGPVPSLVVDFERRGRIEVPYSYLNTKVRPGVSCPLAHSYALTSQAAQGSTYHAGRHLVTDRSSRPGVYVGLTRGRRDARLYMVRRHDLVPPADRHRHLPVLRDELTTLEAVTARLESERHERLAQEVDPDVGAVAELLRTRSLGELGRLQREPGGRDPEAVARAYRQAAQLVASGAALHPQAPVVSRLGRRPQGAARAPWERAVGAIAVYRAGWGVEAWDHGAARPAWALGPRPADDVARAHYDAVAQVLEETAAEIAASTPTADLAIERRQIQRALAANPGSTHHDNALADVAEARRVAESAQDNHDRIEARLKGLQGRPRRNRQGIELARRDLTAAGDALHQATQLLARAQERAEGIAEGVEARRRPEARLAEVEAALDLQVSRAISHPAPCLVAALGDRPVSRREARRWDDGARVIERFRHLELGVDPGDGPSEADDPLVAALGPRPEDPVLAWQWQLTNEAVAALVAQQAVETDIGIEL